MRKLPLGDLMVRHQVFWKYDDGAFEADKETLESKLLALATNDAELRDFGITQIDISLHDSPEGNNQGYTHILSMTFINSECRDVYLGHDRHVAVLNWLGNNPIVESFAALDHARPNTPRSTQVAANHLIKVYSTDPSVENEDALKEIRTELISMLDFAKSNRSAYSIFVKGRPVIGAEEMERNIELTLAAIDAVLEEYGVDVTFGPTS